MQKPLPPDQLYHACKADLLDFRTTAELQGLDEIPGQERALEAIEFSVGIQHEGYNLYVMGSSGLGKHSVVRDSLHISAHSSAPPDDCCYVNNFEAPHRPIWLSLPAGEGLQFGRDMELCIAELREALPAAFQSDDYHQRLQKIRDSFKEKESQMSEVLDEHAEELNIGLMRTQTGFTLAPLKDGKVIGPREFAELPKEEQQEIEHKIESLKDELRESMRHIPVWQRDMNREARALNRQVTLETIDGPLNELEQRYASLPKVVSYLQTVRADILDNEELFLDGDEPSPHRGRGSDLNRYQVNLLVDHSKTQGAPVVYEDNPTYQNLIGRVEHIASMGALLTDFTLVKPGALHRANGGYLVLDADKILTTPFVWQTLKRALKSRAIHIESLERILSLTATVSLEPEPVPLNLKVVLIGDRLLYFLLKEYDPEFIQLFKVAADFAEDLQRSDLNESLFARLIATLLHREGLLEADQAAVCRIIEQSARRASDGEKISLHLDNLLELLQESDFWARKNAHPCIGVQDVQTALDTQTRRMDQWRERLQEQIKRDILLIDTDGIQLGRINGLSVLQLGDYLFGTATRISATARIGSGEIIDIEREVEQGGQIHTKGVMILSSYLARRYAKNQPLSVSATLVFEQTYGEIEGDSASTAELCALLSAIGDIPLKQSLAITGAVNQHGQVQAIGGVNEKIEGFFDICAARGLTGRQGVIIPNANVKDLMLRQDVRQAASEGRFHIHAVQHADEAMELLSGLPAGVLNSDGSYPEQTFNHLIQLRLLEWIALRQQFSASTA